MALQMDAVDNRLGERGVEVVQLPAQPLLAASPLVNQVVAMIDQQLQLAQRVLARPRMIEVRFAQGYPGNRARRSGRT